MQLHWQIITGMVAGLIFGYFIGGFPGGETFIVNWISPFGTIFVKLLKLIAVPLILASLVKGISDLQDIRKFSRMGGRTIGLYILTTLVAITIGLSLVNLTRPGVGIDQATIARLEATYSNDSGVQSRIEEAGRQREGGPLKFLEDIVPENAFAALGDNRLMLQVIFLSIFLGISLLLIPEQQARPMRELFASLNEVVLKMVDLIMLTAPYAVFALIANVVATAGDSDILLALGRYALVVLAGLVTLIGFYLLLISVIAGKAPLWFLRRFSPAQLLAFSTSSSAATLPVTMERVEEHLGVDAEVSGFVLPVGATINMDGTSLYQAVAAVFISQALGHHLAFTDQLLIVLTALLASIGSAAVPGAGMVMLVIVLEAIGFPAEKLAIGLALIFAVDRPLDMCRTVVNVTGDATVAMIVAKTTGKLAEPRERRWNDHLPAGRAS